MCPACITSMALMVVGGTPAGGLTALIVKKLRAKSGAKNISAEPIEGEIHMQRN